MKIDDTPVKNFVKKLEEEGCTKVVLSPRADLVYEVHGEQRTLRDIFTINFVNLVNERVVLFIHLNDLENLYLVRTTEDCMFYRKAHVINSDEQIKQILDNFAKDKSLEGLNKINDHFDHHPRDLMYFYEIGNPGPIYFFFEVLLYPNIQPWVVKDGHSIAVDCEKQLINDAIPFLSRVHF